MRLAFLVESIDLEKGGAERAVMTMARELEKIGQECAIVAPGSGHPGSGHPEKKGPQILTLKLPSLGRAKRARALAEGLAPYAKSQGYDCLVSCGKVLGGHFHWPHGGVHEATLRASCGAGRTPVHRKLSLWAKRLRPVEAVFKDIEKTIFHKALSSQCRLIALSKKVKRDMMAFHSIPESDIEICRNGAPTDLFPELSAEEIQNKRHLFCEEMGLDKKSQLLFFVAMNPRLKGSHSLSKVMRQSPKPQRLFYVGKKPPHRLGPNEHSLGLRSDVPSLLQIAHLLLLPTHYDPCSLVTLEALGAGIPVLTTEHNGAIELLNDKAWLAHSEAEIIRALNDLASDPLQRKRRESALEAAKQWTIQDAAKRFLEILSD